MKRPLFNLSFLAFFLIAASGELPAEPSPDSFEHPTIVEIQSLHTESEAGDKKATSALVEKLESLIAEYPENQLYKAYLGSAYTLRSRDIGFGPSAYSNLKNGLKTMDDAVKAAPDKVPVRFIRAINNFYLPVFVNRRDNARDDFEYLLKQIDKDPGDLSPATKQAIYYFAGVAFVQLRRKEEAKKSLQKGAALAADPKLSTKIAAELKKL